MTDQQSSHASMTDAVKTVYSKRILKAFEPKTAFYRLAPTREDIPQNGGSSIEFTRLNAIGYLYADDTDEFTAQQMYQSSTVVSATLHERNGYVQFSRFLKTTQIAPFAKVANKVEQAATKTLDVLIRNDIGMCVADTANASGVNMNNLAIDGGSLNSSSITAKFWSHDASTSGDRFPMYHNKTRIAQSSTVVAVAKTGATVKTFQAGVNVLRGKNIDPLPDGRYACITYPTVIFQVKTSAGYKGWFAPTSPDKIAMMTDEVDILSGIRFTSTTLGYRFPVSGDTLSTGSGAVFCSLLFGDEAYGVSEVTGMGGGRKGFEFFIKEPGSQTVSDPCNKKRIASFAITAVGKVLNKSAGLWILSTEVTA